MLFIFCRAIVNKRSQICIFLFARIGYNFLVMDGTKKPLEENDIIHRTLSLLPLLNRKVVYPYKPELPENITNGQLQVLLVLQKDRSECRKWHHILALTSSN